jgi:hypothetical protein
MEALPVAVHVLWNGKRIMRVALDSKIANAVRYYPRWKHPCHIFDAVADKSWPHYNPSYCIEIIYGLTTLVRRLTVWTCEKIQTVRQFIGYDLTRIEVQLSHSLSWNYEYQKPNNSNHWFCFDRARPLLKQYNGCLWRWGCMYTVEMMKRLYSHF